MEIYTQSEINRERYKKRNTWIDIHKRTYIEEKTRRDFPDIKHSGNHKEEYTKR